MSSKALEGPPDGLPPRHCAVCHVRDKISRCTGCQVVYYCGRAHQAADRKRHKVACKEIERMVELYESIDISIRIGLGPGDDLETALRLSPDDMETMTYLRAQHTYSQALLLESTIDAVEISLDEQWSVLEVDMHDKLRVRDYMPHLMIRLGQDQEAYDFIKWWTLATDERIRYHDWDDPTAPRMNLTGEDAFEPVDDLVKRKKLFGHKNAVLLIKIRLYLDLRDICNADRALRRGNKSGMFPSEVIDNIKRHNVRSGIVRARRDLVENDGFVASLRMAELKKQIRELARGIFDKDVPEYGGTMDEMFSNTQAAWDETPWAMRTLQDAVRGIAKMSQHNPAWATRSRGLYKTSSG
ncbi:MYND finger [Colletotrichum orchidophilum]|uniref:MYND finger n=1 Tax=Colletotrichum orchidophilum TaxID=1209926 RepID=A0A1G4AN70_9PEZI|nr:MYND finger [Colletotrichum orchidophilum]OHE90535.1 MYND finger [Colletotrichum orchidophilum]